MAKRNHKMAPLRNEQGQISIFFSASLIVLISIIAFVINVGLFVKAKINLQNATDAAAYAGASVQARQLSKIAYLNWEMRNIYKEWMYKYYVVGNLNIKDVENPGSGGKMSFRLEPDERILQGTSAKDPYNLPAVCIHLAGSKTNICKRYAVPGLPEFGGYNLPGSEEASRAFIDSLIGSKINDCVDRSRLNMLAATTWAYNVLSTNLDESLAGQGPAIMADRQGAWPKAIELAMRMRNLEFVMNRPAETGGVCYRQSGGNVKCSRVIDDLVSENQLGNERIVKAFYSGYRNLGGNDPEDEMKNTFTLKEIAPKKPNLGNKFSSSYLLVPENKIDTYKKEYVDLRLMMVNMAIFYAALIPRADSEVSGACDISKVALPVPGYPLGFYKNPDVVTYYAVKGEADFVGMFNPFNSEAIKLTAYSAAKPFGGRIGPMLFIQKDGRDSFEVRRDTGKMRSVPYLSSLNVVGTPKKETSGTLKEGEYTTGAPLPVNGGKAFWLKDVDGAVGGLFNSGDGVQFGIPNMVYDFTDGSFSASGYSESNLKLHIVEPRLGEGGDRSIGLFSKDQFKAFKGNIGGTVTPEALDAAIARVKAPTKYEVANYMVPTPDEFNQRLKVDSFGFIPGTGENNEKTLRYKNVHIYAPLYGAGSGQTDVLYPDSNSVVSSIFQFMRAQESGVLKYKSSLNEGAKAVFNMKNNVAQTAVGSAAQYASAAGGISDIPNLDSNDMDAIRDASPKSCKSLAGLFLNFYYGDPQLFPDLVQDKTLCPQQNLGESLKKYFAGSSGDPNFSATHYIMQYSMNEDIMANSPNKDKSFFSAYTPGPFNGVRENGHFKSPFNGSNIEENMNRNFYSTKFVSLGSLRGGPGFADNQTNFPVYSEGDVQGLSGSDRAQTQFKNTIDAGSVDGDFSSIKY